MEFIRAHVLTAAAAGLGIICLLLSAESFSSILFGAAAASFIFESGMAPKLTDKVRKLLKL